MLSIFSHPFRIMIAAAFIVAGVVYISSFTDRTTSTDKQKVRALASVPQRTFARNPISQRTEADTLFGLDLSHDTTLLSREIDLETNISFVICKASYGSSYIDPLFYQVWDELSTKNVRRGACHFYDPSREPASQALHFYRTVGNLTEKDMPPVVDVGKLMTNPVTNQASETIPGNLLLFLEEVEKLTSRKPVIYVGRAFADRYLTDTAFAHYDLYLQHNGDLQKPALPETWKNKGYLLRHNSAQSGSVKPVIALEHGVGKAGPV